jgi:energy-coupling factor transport system substrate-specific component
MNKLISRISVGVAGLASLLIFTWPLFISTGEQNETLLAQTVFIVLMPLVLILVLIEFATGDISSKHLALLGVLIALNAVIRLLGAGTAGIETAFFLIILGAFVFGSGFGFILGACSILVSALLTGGIGPWLPFQMMGAALVGLGAGLIPRSNRAWLQKVHLVGYAVFASFSYGGLLTMWNWPYLAGTGTQLSYVAGDAITANLSRFIQYEIVTGGLVWDMGRAITTSVLILLTGTALISTLKRAAIRAGVGREL